MSAGSVPTWARVLHYGSVDLDADPDAHQREVLRLRDTRAHQRLEATTANADVAATVYTTLDNLAVGENLTVYRDADGFRVNRSGRPIPTVSAAEVGLDELDDIDERDPGGRDDEASVA